MRSLLLVLLSATLLSACAALNQISQTAEDLSRTADDIDKTAQQVDKTSNDLDHTKTKVEDTLGKVEVEGSQSNTQSSASCCVNGAFYECPNAASATQCLGEPMSLGNCLSACADDPCTEQCFSQYGPNPSSCQRAQAKDAECGN